MKYKIIENDIVISNDCVGSVY